MIRNSVRWLPLAVIGFMLLPGCHSSGPEGGASSSSAPDEIKEYRASKPTGPASTSDDSQVRVARTPQGDSTPAPSSSPDPTSPEAGPAHPVPHHRDARPSSAPAVKSGEPVSDVPKVAAPAEAAPPAPSTEPHGSDASVDSRTEVGTAAPAVEAAPHLTRPETVHAPDLHPVPASLHVPNLRSAVPPAVVPHHRASVRHSDPTPDEELPAPRHRAGHAGGSSRLALIIDDVGMSTAQIQPFLNLNADLTYSIIPETRQARRCLSLVESRGHVPMLHLPMQPMKRTGLLSASGITVDLPADEIERRVNRYLDGLQGVRGVNNHMGSRATQDERVMESVLTAVKQHGLFFIDSKTAQRTVVSSVADRLGVAHAARDGEFLDDGGNTSRAYEILLSLGREAQRNGSAIGIGHPHPGTAAAIERALPELEAMGVQIVPASELVHGG